MEVASVYICDDLAKHVTEYWMTWNQARSDWIDNQKELREYLFGTSTRDTSNKKLPWKNSTVTPKLTQIRDNLHANYMAALFPNERWFVWEGEAEDATAQEKRHAIEAFMRQKLRQQDFEKLVNMLVLDYIDFGNVFAGHEYVDVRDTDPVSGVEFSAYRGPRAYRIAPADIVMNPLATSFAKTPIVVRTVLNYGDMLRRNQELVNQGYDLDKMAHAGVQRSARNDEMQDFVRSANLSMDGFGSYFDYLKSGQVELLDFYGDTYDSEGNFYMDRVITVMDRTHVVRNAPIKSISGGRPAVHCGWRLRADNLWAQGPLDQLVGMQYRIDHLENLKADVFDQIAHPVVKVKGDTVEDFVFGPGEVIYCGTDGDVVIDRPDAAALQADFQIRELMDRMEDLAGAPKQAMGIRTPGEKTKYEVQVLENGAGRIFQAKVSWFERNVIEPLLNSMLADAVVSMNATEKVKTVDELGIETYIEVSREDLKAAGRIYPMGARHHAERARFVQELSQTLQAVQGLPGVAVHFSGKAAAKALEEALGWKRWNIVKDNAAVFEQLETQRLTQAGGEQVDTEAGIPTELQPTDFASPEDQVTNR